jgi:formate-nitrite transporter family protein
VARTRACAHGKHAAPRHAPRISAARPRVPRCARGYGSCAMSGRSPDEIWEEGLDEGERRLARSPVALAATAFAGGLDVFFSVLLLAVTSAGLHAAMPEASAHVIASLTFGVGFAFITLGRAELFTENFLVPVGAVWARRAPLAALLRMWLITLVGNIAGLTLFAALFSVSGVLGRESLAAAGTLADTVGERGALAAFVSGIAAGTIMTLFTWVVAAAETGTARVLASLLIGFVLAAPSLNHAIVGFGEQIFGLFAGTAHTGWGDLLRTVSLAVAGNLVGGVGLVFGTRLAQVRGEPDSESGEREARGADTERPPADA